MRLAPFYQELMWNEYKVYTWKADKDMTKLDATE